jgi:hypothetical protein
MLRSPVVVISALSTEIVASVMPTPTAAATSLIGLA